MSDPLVQVEGLSKRYRRGAEEVRALREVGFSLYPGELVALVGPSGSGKSSLLGVLCGWDLPDQGKVLWSADLGAEPTWAELSVVPQALRFADRILSLEDGGLEEVSA